nr:MAG TPA: hypothetical protein [Caudoviricetes sp.]
MSVSSDHAVTSTGGYIKRQGINLHSRGMLTILAWYPQGGVNLLPFSTLS